MKYILLLRGVNVGGRNKVKMDEVKLQLSNLGFLNVVSYINSGNLIFDSHREIQKVKTTVKQMLVENYTFEILFALVKEEDYRKASENLPHWWSDTNLARRDVLFFTDEVNKESMIDSIRNMNLYKEVVHYTDIAVFWGKTDEKEYMKTAYHKHLASKDFYKQITIRNGNTFDKILSLLNK